MNEVNNNNDILIYEVGYHLLPTVHETNVPAQSLHIKSIIEENGGIVISEDIPKMIILAYDIFKNIDSQRQKFDRAYFGWMKFEAEPSKMGEIENKIKATQNVLRFLIVKTIRENTMHTPKVPMFRRESNKGERTEERKEKQKASNEEIDKSIDELVINQTL